MEISTNVLLAAAGGCAALVGLAWAAVKRAPAMKWPRIERVKTPDEQFLTDLALVLDLQARLVKSGNVPAVRLCDQIKLEMLKAPVPTPKEPEKRAL